MVSTRNVENIKFLRNLGKSFKLRAYPRTSTHIKRYWGVSGAFVYGFFVFKKFL